MSTNQDRAIAMTGIILGAFMSMFVPWYVVIGFAVIVGSIAMMTNEG